MTGCPETGRPLDTCRVCRATGHLPEDCTTRMMRRGLHRLVAVDAESPVVGEVPALDRETWRKARVPDAPPPWVNEAWELEYAYRQPDADRSEITGLTEDDDLLAWLQASWASNDQPTQADVDMMRNYWRRTHHPDPPLTWRQIIEGVVWVAVAVGLIVAAGWILQRGYVR